MITLSGKLAELEAAAAKGAAVNWAAIERHLTAAEGKLTDLYRRRGALEGIRVTTQEDVV